MWKLIAALVVLAALVGGYLMRPPPLETPVFGMPRPICGPLESCGPPLRSLEDFLGGEVIVVGRVTQAEPFSHWYEKNGEIQVRPTNYPGSVEHSVRYTLQVERVLKGKAVDTIRFFGRNADAYKTERGVNHAVGERLLVICHRTSFDDCYPGIFDLNGPVVRFREHPPVLICNRAQSFPCRPVRFGDRPGWTVFLLDPRPMPPDPYASDPYTIPPDAFTVSPDDFIERVRAVVR